MLREKLNSKKEEGFTIIEVLIVLAVAGLILLIVFLAVPALQRNSRNTSRREDVAHLDGLINEYVANHAGNLPTGICGGLGAAACVANQTVNVDVTSENFSIMTAGAIVANANWPAAGANTTVNVNTGETCNAITNTLSAGTARAFALTYWVETGGADAKACVTG